MYYQYPVKWDRAYQEQLLKFFGKAYDVKESKDLREVSFTFRSFVRDEVNNQMLAILSDGRYVNTPISTNQKKL